MVETDKLTTGLRSIAGCVIDQIGLLIWPDERGPKETDVRLYLELGRPGEGAIDVVIGTSSDGQTPAVEFRHVDGGRPLSELENRRREWARDGFWESQAFVSSELFFASPSVVSQSDGIFCSAALARRTLARMSSAFFVQTNPSGCSLC